MSRYGYPYNPVAPRVGVVGNPILNLHHALAQGQQTNLLLQEQLRQLQETIAALQEENTRLTESNTRLTESNTRLTESNTRLTESNTRLTERNADLEKSLQEAIGQGVAPSDPGRAAMLAGGIRDYYTANPWLEEANKLVQQDSRGMLTQSLLYNLPAVIACYKQHEEHIKIAFDNAIRGRAYFEPFLLLIYHLAVLVKNDEVRADLINHFSTVPEDDLRVQSWGGSSLSELFDELTPLLKDLKVLERYNGTQWDAEKGSYLLQVYWAAYCIAEKKGEPAGVLFNSNEVAFSWRAFFEQHKALIPEVLHTDLPCAARAISKRFSDSSQRTDSPIRAANRGLTFGLVFSMEYFFRFGLEVGEALLEYHHHHPVYPRNIPVDAGQNVARARKRTHGEIDDARDEVVDWSAAGFSPLFPLDANKRQRKGKEPQAQARAPKLDLSSYYPERSGWLAKGNQLIEMNAYGEIRGSLFESLDAIIRLYMANKAAIDQALHRAVKGEQYFEPFTLLIYSIGLLMRCEEAVNELDAHFQEREKKSLKESLSGLSDLKECEAVKNIMSAKKLIMVLSAAICSREKSPSNKSEFYGDFFKSCAFFTYSTDKHGGFFTHFLRVPNRERDPAEGAVKLANRSLILRCFFGSALYLPPNAKQEIVDYYASYPRAGAPTGPGCA